MRKVQLAAAALIGLGVAANAQQQYGAGDIERLVRLKVESPDWFKASVAGVGRFSGVGTVRETDKGWGTHVTMGQADVTCMAPAPGLSVGDKVQVTGVVGSVSTAAFRAELNRIGKLAGNNNPPLPEVPGLSLLTDGCAVRKVQ